MADSKKINQMIQVLQELEKKYKMPFFGTTAVGKVGNTIYAFGGMPHIPLNVVYRLR